MITVHTGAGESRIVCTGDGYTAVYAGVNTDAPVRSNELFAALDLIELVSLYEGLLIAQMVTETLRSKLAELGYTL